ncbi:hypothetical protein HYT45_01405 [Candidatus Uhrbacteria bacterium]|nr:hypothetical protein [Candidatus Uhrbacteria bacterium]
MSRYLSATHYSLFAGAASRRRTSVWSVLRVDSRFLILGAVILALSAGYIVLSNVVAAANFKLRDERVHIEELLLQNKKAESELANRESIARLEEEARRIGLVPIGRVEYVEPGGGPVALK